MRRAHRCCVRSTGKRVLLEPAQQSQRLVLRCLQHIHSEAAAQPAENCGACSILAKNFPAVRENSLSLQSFGLGTVTGMDRASISFFPKGFSRCSGFHDPAPLLVALALATVFSSAVAAEQPQVVRIIAIAGVQNGKLAYTGTPAVVQRQGWLAEQLGKRNIRLEWVPVSTASVAAQTNEALAKKKAATSPPMAICLRSSPMPRAYPPA